MNKVDLINKVMEQADLGKAEATSAVTAVFDVITAALKTGEQVSLAGFGIFQAKERAARQGRNPQTGATITIAASKAATFKPAKGLKDTLNG